MNTNITNLFYVKRAKPNKNGEVPIFQRVTIDGQRIEASTGKFINPNLWSTESSKVIGKSEQARSINSHLNTLINEVIEAEKNLIANRKPVNYLNLKKILKKESDPERTFLPIFQSHNDKMLALVPTGEYAIGTWKHFRTALKHLQEFMLSKYKITDISIFDIDYAFVMDFDFYLRTKKEKCSNNTAIKYIQKIHQVFSICLDNEWIQKDPFAKYHEKLSIVDRGYLNQYEIDTICAKHFIVSRLELVRDIFIFSCYTGLAYIEVQRLSQEHISVGIDGQKWIFIKRQKTDGPSRIPLLPIALQIIEKYKKHPKCINSNQVLPILSNQRMNSYLKEIGDVCGINKELTFHLARHSFATTITLTNGVPLESVGKMLGHRSIKSTQIYARVLDEKLSQDMESLKQKIGNKNLLQSDNSKNNLLHGT